MSEKIFEEIAQKIKRIRLDNGLSQKEMAERLGLKRANYSKVENGTVIPTTKTLIQLNKHFNISIDWILTGKGSQMGTPLGMNDEDLNELFTAMQEDKGTKHAVLAFYYEYKVDRIRKLGKSENENSNGGNNESHK